MGDPPVRATLSIKLSPDNRARQVGCQSDEIAVTRSGADALQMLIVNYKPLKAGDPLRPRLRRHDAALS
ncbi:MAG: hypothetical protein KA085_17210 [Phenylobacterium sp.]|nr:hypothetical protein [Phenylobacterium sp.]MBP7817859.1 hypothetical protein [Phenylobacterium sp.]